MVYGTIVEITPSIYCTTDTINFTVLVDDENEYYMEIEYTECDEPQEALYFKWNDIPKSIYTLYLHAKKFSKKVYNNNKSVSYIGTHLLRGIEHNYNLITLGNDPSIEPIKITFECCEDFKKENEFDELAKKMISVKKYTNDFLQGPPPTFVM
jgi:hypothetical protein